MSKLLQVLLLTTIAEEAIPIGIMIALLGSISPQLIRLKPEGAFGRFWFSLRFLDP